MKKNKIIIIFLLIVSLSFITVNVYADDYPDDIYDGDYSLQEMLENYNIITFGKKDLDSRMPNEISYNSNNKFSIFKGDATIFHINSLFLVSGELRPSKNNKSSYDYYPIRLDLRIGTNNLESYAKNIYEGYGLFCGYRNDNSNNNLCNINSSTVPNYIYTENSIRILSPTSASYSIGSTSAGKYMNFDRLYDSIINDQKHIKKGRTIDLDNDVAHIETGGEYYIDDINELNEIVFDNFKDNEDNLTVITINNTGDIHFPKIYASENNDEKSLIPTNDFIGMERPNSDYADYYVIDKYHGNIIWNIPNATYIELPSAPFIGHLVAPNADLYGPELHYAGAFLVNSLYLEGNSEAHFYPLTSTKIPYRSNPEPVKAKLNIKRNQGNIKFHNNVNNDSLEEGMVVSFKVEAESNYLLSGMEIKDEEENIIEFKEIGDGEYEFTMPATNVTITPKFVEKNIKNTIEQIITNPKTGNKFFFLLGIIIISSIIGFRKIKKANKI